MLGRIQQAGYNLQTGEVTIELATSNINGLPNVVTQYNAPGIISIPLITQVPNLDVQNKSQTQITGYSNALIDTNYSVLPGEFTSYSANWYSSVRISGVEIQQAQTSNVENVMMGQSTNAVLIDILQMIIDITNYLNAHTHAAGSYNIPGTGAVVGDSGIVVTTAPSYSDISTDLTYIQGNENLAITGVYQPKV